jgi:hypothetical protein
VTSFWKRHFIACEFTAACVAVAIVFVWAHWYGGDPVIGKLVSGNRSAIYAALASIFGSLLGFGITAVSIVVAAINSDNLAVLRKSRHYPTLWRVFTVGIRYLAFATVASLLALILDRDSSPSWRAFYLCLLASVWAVAGVARSIWVLENIIQLLTASTPRS